MKKAASSITLEDVIKKHEVPSTHAYCSKNVVDKTITLGKVEATVEVLIIILLFIKSVVLHIFIECRSFLPKN